MDDENIYGKIIATVSAKKARELGRICNYKIITIELKPLIIDIVDMLSCFVNQGIYRRKLYKKLKYNLEIYDVKNNIILYINSTKDTNIKESCDFID